MNGKCAQQSVQVHVRRGSTAKYFFFFFFEAIFDSPIVTELSWPLDN